MPAALQGTLTASRYFYSRPAEKLNRINVFLLSSAPCIILGIARSSENCGRCNVKGNLRDQGSWEKGRDSSLCLSVCSQCRCDPDRSAGSHCALCSPIIDGHSGLD